MKKNLSILFALFLLALTSCQEKIDIEKEKEAIKAVINEEVALYLNQDFIQQSDKWKKEDYVLKILNFGKSHNQIVGWDSINADHKKDSEMDWSAYTNEKSESKDIKIKVYDEIAWAAFYQQWTGENKGVPFNLTQSRVYFFEKVDDKWKIVLMTVTNLDSGETEDTQ